MDILDWNKLTLFIIFVVPGFISLKTYDLLCPRGERKTADQLIDAVAYSSINFALLLWPIYEMESNDVSSSFPTAYVLFYVFVLFVAPVTWACLFLKMRRSKFIQLAAPHPTLKPWDFFFSGAQPCWVIVTLKDGKQIAGKFGQRSFASSTPASEQLYLEEAWVVSGGGGLERARKNTGGILVLSPDIVTVEFFAMNFTGGNQHGAERDGQPEKGLPAAGEATR